MEDSPTVSCGMENLTMNRRSASRDPTLAGLLLILFPQLGQCRDELLGRDLAGRQPLAGLLLVLHHVARPELVCLESDVPVLGEALDQVLVILAQLHAV